MPELQLTEEQWQQLEQAYIDNECATDEYRETQPEKASESTSYVLQKMVSSPQQKTEIKRAFQRWILAWVNGIDGNSYAGADEARDLYHLIFQAYKRQREHPYNFAQEDALDWLNSLN